MGSPWPEFGMYLSTILANNFLHPKDPNFNYILMIFKHFWGVIKMHNPINREPYSSLKGVYEPSEALVYSRSIHKDDST